MTVDKYEKKVVEHWEERSNEDTPNQAIYAGNEMAGKIEDAAEALEPGPNDVIDVHLIGHSRGAVVISQAVTFVQSSIAAANAVLSSPPWAAALARGFFKMTLLDPHPANNVYGFNADSDFNPLATGLATGLARNAASLYVQFQARVHDPAVFIPSQVNEVDVLYQTTSVSQLGWPENILNLHGLDPSMISVQDSTRTRILAKDLTKLGKGHSEVVTWYSDNVVKTGTLGAGTTPSDFGPPDNSPTSRLLSGAEVGALTSASLWPRLNAYRTLSVIVANDNDLEAVISAVNNLDPPLTSTTTSVLAVFVDGTYLGPRAVMAPAWVTVLLIGNGTTGTFVGHSPALSVLSGTVLAMGITFTTETDSPTIQVSGGSLYLRDCDIEESTGFDQAAITVLDGALDLGSPDDPGRNTLNVNGTGELVHNTTANNIAANGNTLQVNGAVTAPNLSFTALASSNDNTVYGQAVTLTATVRANSSVSETPSGTVHFVDTTTNTDLGSVSLSGGSASLDTFALVAGNHLIRATYNGDGTFTLSLVSLTQTVTPAPLTITANSMIKTYGDSVTFAGTEFTSNGLVNGDTVSRVTLASAGTDTTATVAGSPYAIAASVAVGTGLSNYAIRFANGELTLNTKTLTVTGNDALRIYGAANPSFTASYSGFANAETLSTSGVSGNPSLTTLATGSSHVGGYFISTALGSLAASNYEFAFEDGTLTITPATLTITAADQAREFGQPNPPLTANFTGFVNGDSSANLTSPALLSTAAIRTSPLGSYAITVSSAASPDYIITFVTGTLTVIAPATPVVFLASDPNNPALNALYVSGTSGDDKIRINSNGEIGELRVRININGKDEDESKFRSTVTPPPLISRIIVFGQAANDDIQVVDSITISAELHGDAGNDRIKGGAGNDILTGGDGDDLLVGGSGRDLMTGGYGSDRLVGNADDDILIAGVTDFDANEIALRTIMKEWTSGHSYADRVKNLSGTGMGSRLNGDVFLKVDEVLAGGVQVRSTVHDDGAVDILTGCEGQDWFIFNADGQRGSVKDKATDLNAHEFASDIDFINGP